ncbi:MAG: transposase [Gammaproteobacteria bacterium]|nr:transposase [Gammaproteobacteria bacterium]
MSCYEAGRDGFWIHRALVAEGIDNKVLDSASIEVSRRQKQVKTDRVDVIALLRLLMRYMNGEKQALHSNRIKSLLVVHGIVLEKICSLPVMEFFNWRQFKNAKQVGACAG